MAEKSIKAFKVFVREELKTVRLFQSDKGRFLIQTSKLDRDSLSVEIVNIVMPESTIMIVTRMFMGGFLEKIKLGERLDIFKVL